MESLESVNIILGIVVSICSLVGLGAAVSKLIKKYKQTTKNGSVSNVSEGESTNVNGSSINGNGGIQVQGSHNIIGALPANAPGGSEEPNIDIVDLKGKCQILFIDDDKTPSVIKTLRKSGWKNIKRIGDTANLDLPEIRAADIIFVDIKGVGQLMKFKNEGVGLAAALKERYNKKGVVIYSATEEHNLFDPDIKKVDDWLFKNAEPIQFSNMIEQYGKPKD